MPDIVLSTYVFVPIQELQHTSDLEPLLLFQSTRSYITQS